MDSEEHLVGCRTAGVVRCRTVGEQFDQQLMLALRGTPWDAKGKLATLVPAMGGLPPPTAASASATRGSDASTGPANPVVTGAAPEA
eukprot:4976110-Amphidinium_carterae.1